MPSVYQRERIADHRGEPLVTMGFCTNFVQHQEPITDDEAITPGCRTLILNAVREAVARTKFRMSVIWGEEEASYVELDGSINQSTKLPLGGVQLPNKIAFDQRVIVDLPKD